MDFFTTCNGIPLRASVEGKGDTIVLLHGYLETMEVWRPFAAQLAKHYRVLMLDLPGHGLSGWNGGEHSMEYMADTLNELLTKQGIDRCLLVGHSMGGYAALAFAKKYDDRVSGLCLFHSTPNPDSDEKKANRDREIEAIRADKLAMVVQQSIPRTFAEANHKRMKEQIWDLEESAEVADKNGIIACLQGMKSREDMNPFLATYTKPLLFIFGKSDVHIPFDVAQQLMERFPQADTLILEQSGHQGYLEQPKESLDGVLAFAGKVFGK